MPLVIGGMRDMDLAGGPDPALHVPGLGIECVVDGH